MLFVRIPTTTPNQNQNKLQTNMNKASRIVFCYILIFGSFACFILGVWHVFNGVEKNACRMTYMFQQPQFAEIPIEENVNNYKLFYYYEGVKLDIRSVKFKGAPVLFIPGNAGSYKQVRSLASVALRKAIDAKFLSELDYFTIDYNEELSALYGGYLLPQIEFLRVSIERVKKLYKPKAKKITLIGHSMGGKIAEAIFANASMASNINTIITISAPLKKPVLNIDRDMSNFYENSAQLLIEKRASNLRGFNTDSCLSYPLYPAANTDDSKSDVQNVLLISIGGGNRDTMVASGLTTSQFVDLHAMTSSIPHVWLSCDHLAAVWCLQFTLVVNRFLYQIVHKDNGQTNFIEDKGKRFQRALHFFIKPNTYSSSKEGEYPKDLNEHEEHWNESPQRIFYRHFPRGIKRTFNQLIKLSGNGNSRKLFVDSTNLKDRDWLYGCMSNQLPNGENYCEQGTSLAHYIRLIPSTRGTRSIALMALHNIQKAHSNWTHINLRLLPSSNAVQVNVDIHDAQERLSIIKMPNWLQLKEKIVINETILGTMYYKLQIENLYNTYESLLLHVKTVACKSNTYQATVRVCVPWAPGFDVYYTLSESSSPPMYINTPVASPKGYNASRSPVTVEIILDATCRFSIGYKYAIIRTLSRIAHEYCAWVPAHLVTVLCLVLKNHLAKSESNGLTQKPFLDFFQYSSLLVVTGCRLLNKLLLNWGYVSTHEAQMSLLVSTIVHGTAITTSIVMSVFVWGSLFVHSSIVFKALQRFNMLSILKSASNWTSIVGFLPISFCVLAISISISTTCGISLVLACMVYFLLLSDTYKEIQENAAWEKVINVLNKLKPSPGSTEAVDNKSGKKDEEEPRGLTVFSYHFVMFLLLVVMTALNIPTTVAWFKNYRKGPKLSEPGFISTSVVLICLGVLWQLKAPTRVYGRKFSANVLYACAIACVLFCQEAMYRLNDVIAVIYALMAASEIIPAVTLWFM